MSSTSIDSSRDDDLVVGLSNLVTFKDDLAYIRVGETVREYNTYPSPPLIKVTPFLTDEELEDLLEWEKTGGKDFYYSDNHIPKVKESLFNTEFPGSTPKSRKPVTSRGGVHQPILTPQIIEEICSCSVQVAKKYYEQGEFLHAYQYLTRVFQLCTYTVEYPSSIYVVESIPYPRFRAAKSELLRDIIIFGRESNFLFLSNEACLRAAIEMIAQNIFRPIPPRSDTFTDEEDGPSVPLMWEEVLHFCYDFFLNILSAQHQPDIPANHPAAIPELTKTLKQIINSSFVLKLVEAFNSEIHLERDFLKTLLHRIYAKFMSLRATIRKALNNYFYVFVYERDELNGVSEMLEILGSIINGFALPLKNEHVLFFKRVLLILHKSPRITVALPQLSYCVVQFVDKDPSLSIDVFNALARYWPYTSSSKSVMFLTILEECLEAVDPSITKSQQTLSVIASLAYRGMSSPHFAVAERAACIWQSEICSNILCEKYTLSELISRERYGMFENSHWNMTIRALLEKILDHMKSLASQIVDDAEREYRFGNIKNIKENHKKRVQMYDKLAEKAYNTIKDFPGPPLRSSADKLPPFV